MIGEVSRKEPDWAVIELAGEIDLARVDELALLLERNWLPSQNLLIDLSPVTFMDSTAIRWLFNIHQQMGRLDREMRLIVAQSSQIERLLEIVGAEGTFSISHERVPAWRRIIRKRKNSRQRSEGPN